MRISSRISSVRSRRLGCKYRAWQQQLLQCDSQSRITRQAKHKRPKRGRPYTRPCPCKGMCVRVQESCLRTTRLVILPPGTCLVHGWLCASVLVGCYACGMSHYSGGAPSQCKADRCKHEARDPGGVGLARMGPKEPKTDASLVVDGVRTWLLDPAREAIVGSGG
jgi:hypothetical protein